MPGGRPPKDGGLRRYAELEELAGWFRKAVTDAGYESLNAVVRAEIVPKGVVYGVCGASRFFRVDAVRAFATGLRRDPDEAERLWMRAKDAVDRTAAAQEAATAPRLGSWAQLPLPELPVRMLVEAQSRAVERLPYDMLGVAEPPLSAVYVRQRVRTFGRDPAGEEPGGVRTAERGTVAVGDDEEDAADSVLPAPDALSRHEHLLITGEPGAGKSTFSSHLAWTLSRIWLRDQSVLEAPLSEPVVPVRVAARTLVGGTGSFSEVLREAVCRSLGSALIEEPGATLFTGRVQGARWLIMVDGLDEIADREARVGIIRTVAQHARTGSDYRFVITSRPLPEAELAPLRGSLVGAYRMEPFGEAELRDFADKWFMAQYEDDAERARSAADRFLKETEDKRISELVRNPLLATIAAVNATVAPSRPLPTSRLSLYQRFCDHLLTPAPRCADASRRTPSAATSTCGWSGRSGSCSACWDGAGWRARRRCARQPPTGSRARTESGTTGGQRTWTSSCSAPACWSRTAPTTASCTTPSRSSSRPARTPSRYRRTSRTSRPGSGAASPATTVRWRCSCSACGPSGPNARPT